MSMTTNVRLSDEAEAAVRAIAAREGRSLNEVINRSLIAVESQFSRRAYVSGLFEQADVKWAPVLERLAEA